MSQPTQIGEIFIQIAAAPNDPTGNTLMFKSISNNFGAPEITFRDFQTDRYVVLNARFSYDPTNEDYHAASELEIKVPGLSLPRSTDAGVFAVYKDERTYHWSDTPSRYHFATVLRSRIRDRNTLCIEKLTDFDAYGPVTVYIYAMYSALNTGENTVLSERTRLNISTVPEMSTLMFTDACVVSDRWVSLNLILPYSISSVKEDLEIVMDGFPTDAVCGELPVIGVSNQLHPELGGVHYASIRDGRMLIPYATRNTGYSSADKPFASLVLVRGTDDNI